MVKVWNVVDDQDTGKRNVSLVTSRDLGIVCALLDISRKTRANIT